MKLVTAFVLAAGLTLAQTGTEKAVQKSLDQFAKAVVGKQQGVLSKLMAETVVYSHSNGNTFEVMTEAHKIRDRVFERLPADVADTGEQLDCVVVGGGISGLAAALFFQRAAGSVRC